MSEHVHTLIYAQSLRAYYDWGGWGGGWCWGEVRVQTKEMRRRESQMLPTKCKLANTMTKLRLCVFPFRIKINSLNQLIMFIRVASCTALVSGVYIVIDLLIGDDSYDKSSDHVMTFFMYKA